MVSPPLKWHGGKSYLAKRIVALMPPHLHYVEPYFGGGAVLLAKSPEGVSEVVNDLHSDLTNFWVTLQHAESFAKYSRQVEATPFSEYEWDRATSNLRHCDDAPPYLRAVWFFVACRQSLAGRMDSFAPLSRSRTRRGMNEQASAWVNAVEGLHAVHARLKRVVILARPALEVIRQQDGPDTLFYCDPPYLHQTRSTTGEYQHEMTEEDHCKLLGVLRAVEGKAVISGYPSDLYDDELADWWRHSFDLPNHAAGGKGKRRMTEVLWCNFTPEEAPAR